MSNFASTRRLGKRLAKTLKVISKLVCSGKAEKRLDPTCYVVSFGDKCIGVNDGAHAVDSLCGEAFLGATLEFPCKHAFSLQRPPLLNVGQASLDRRAAFPTAYVVGHISNIIRKHHRVRCVS